MGERMSRLIVMRRSDRLKRVLISVTTVTWRKRGGTWSAPPGVIASNAQLPVASAYSDRRKFRTSCFWLALSELKLATTVFASEPLLR
jgi:hypothetical protein